MFDLVVVICPILNLKIGMLLVLLTDWYWRDDWCLEELKWHYRVISVEGRPIELPCLDTC